MERDVTVTGVAGEAKALYGVRVAPISVVATYFSTVRSPSKNLAWIGHYL